VTRNAAERECGDGALQLGELCDPGLALGESCASLGQGDGTLACGDFCTPDTRQCQAPSCGRTGPAQLRVSGARGAARLTLEIAALETGGRSFDPRAEDVEVVLRGDEGVVWSGQIPGGSRGWREGADGALVYEDRAARRDGIRRLAIGGSPTVGASLELKRADVSGLGASEVAIAVLRVADDCWRGELACDPKLAGPGAHCTRATLIPPPWTPPPPPEDDGGGSGGPCAYCSY
jgi:hypothetical protein